MSIKFRLHGELYMLVNILTYAWFVNMYKNGKLIQGIVYDTNGVIWPNDGMIRR